MIHELLAATLAFEPPWQVPPPPPSSPRIADVARTLDEVLFPAADAASDDPRLPRTRRVILQGPWGSGRRSGALTLAAQVRPRHPGGGFVVVASELRGSGAQRRLCNAYGQRLPTSLAGPALAQAYRDVLRPHAGLLIIDARHGVDGDALDALLPPDTWTCIVLLPERARVLPDLPRISLGGSIAIDASAGLDDDSDAARLAQAARLFDPAAGAKRSILVRIADVAPEHGGAAVDALVERGVLIALAHDRRVAAARGSSGLIAPAIARRFVATYGELGTMVATAATADERAHARTIVAIEWPNLLRAVDRLEPGDGAIAATLAELLAGALIDDPALRPDAARLLALADPSTLPPERRGVVALYRAELLAHDDPAAAAAWFEDAARRAEAEGGAVLPVDLLLRSARLHERASDLDGASRALDHAWHELATRAQRETLLRLREVLVLTVRFARRRGHGAALRSRLIAARALADDAGLIGGAAAARLLEAELVRDSGDRAAAIALADEALDGFTRDGDGDGVLDAAALLVELHLRGGAVAAADAAWQRGSSCLGPERAPRSQARAWETYGELAQHHGDAGLARQAFAAALALFNRSGGAGRSGEARVARRVAKAAAAVGDFAEAAVLTRRALAILGELRDTAGHVLGRLELADALARTGKAQAALVLVGDSRRDAEAHGLEAEANAAALAEAECQLRLGANAEALARFGDARARFAARGDAAGEALAWRGVAACHGALGSPEVAIDHALDTARAALATCGDPAVAMAIELATMTIALDRRRGAIALAAALTLAEQGSAHGDRYYETIAHCGRAQALGLLGQRDLARLALDDANRAAQAAGSLELQMMVEGARTP